MAKLTTSARPSRLSKLSTAVVIAAGASLFADASLSAQQSRPTAKSSQQTRDADTSRVDRQRASKRAAAKKAADKKAARQARKFRQSEVQGEEVATNVQRIVQRLHWHSSLKSALQSARQKNKPLLWIQALGDLEGFL